MEPIKLAIAIVALAVSVLSLFISQLASRRAKKAEDVKALLGEKEAVAFAGLKLLRDGLPRDGRQSTLIIRALVQACLFEGSDRARALLYRVIEKNREHHREDFLKVSSITRIPPLSDHPASPPLPGSLGRRRACGACGRRAVCAVQGAVEKAFTPFSIAPSGSIGRHLVDQPLVGLRGDTR